MRQADKAIRISQEEFHAAAMQLSNEADIKEMAIPSYEHRFGLIRWLFWRRLDSALLLANLQRGESALDFGAGSGVLLSSLAAKCKTVYATDIFTQPARALVHARGLSNVHIVEHPECINEVITSPVDCVFALDVLEHVKDLRPTLDKLGACLNNTGRLVVSGPTETIFYKIGRLVAGFHNEYHERNIRDILQVALESGWHLRKWAREPPFPLPKAFEMYLLTKETSV